MEEQSYLTIISLISNYQQTLLVSLNVTHEQDYQGTFSASDFVDHRPVCFQPPVHAVSPQRVVVIVPSKSATHDCVKQLAPENKYQFNDHNITKFKFCEKTIQCKGHSSFNKGTDI